MTTEYVTSKPTWIEKLSAVRKLARWRQHVPYTLPAVIAGALIAIHLTDSNIDWRLLPVVLANVLAMAFAFIINDVVDAPDDAVDLNKTGSNLISSGFFSPLEGNIIAGLTFLTSLILFALGGWRVMLVGATTLILCYLYSAPPARLKSRPVVDIVSHVLMLSGLLMLSGYFLYDTSPGVAWLMIAAVTLGSAYGQFYNQLNDFDADRNAGLRTTAILLGENLARTAMYGSIVLAIALFAAAMLQDVFPDWLGSPLLAIIFTLTLFRWNHDMRGKPTDASGTIQQPLLIGANIITLLWLLAELGLM